MKLIVCRHCTDIVKMDTEPRYCKCGRSGGRYLDDIQAEFWGDCVPLGIDNGSMCDAINRQPDSGQGRVFEAFVIPKECPTFRQIEGAICQPSE